MEYKVVHKQRQDNLEADEVLVYAKEVPQE